MIYDQNSPHILHTTFNIPVEVRRPRLVVQAFDKYHVMRSIDGVKWSVVPIIDTDRQDLDPLEWNDPNNFTPCDPRITYVFDVGSIYLWIKVVPVSDKPIKKDVFLSY